jgi:hypothetical protein
MATLIGLFLGLLRAPLYTARVLDIAVNADISYAAG